MEVDVQATPFRVQISADAIQDLNDRIARTRWSPSSSFDWAAGADPEAVRALLERWRNGYDWDGRLRLLNALPWFQTSIAGSRVRFIHRTGEVEGAMPLLLCHGWPDSTWRYRKVVEPLAQPAVNGGDAADAFHVVVPDMPGFGWSEASTNRDIDSREVARRWYELMTSLGYDRFVVAGGDIGSHVARYLALDHPESVIAVHRMDAGLPTSVSSVPDLTREERDWMASAAAWAAEEGAYAAVHRTKPQTAATGLTDSPAGLAAWIVEKLHAWSDGGLDAYSQDEVLDLLTDYWFTSSIGSSVRMYRSNSAIAPDQLARYVQTPSGFSIFAGDIVRPPLAWMQRTTNLVFHTEPPHGGHFAPFEQPDLYTRQLRDFARPFRT